MISRLFVPIGSRSALIVPRSEPAVGNGDVTDWEARLSLRARLALVLVGIMVGPLLAAGVTVGVLVPRASDRAADAELRRSVAAAGSLLAARCQLLAGLARSASAALTAAGPTALDDPTVAVSVLTPELGERSGVTLLLLTGDRVSAAAGPLSTGWDPVAAGDASCTARRPPAGGQAPALVESLTLPAPITPPGRAPDRVLAVQGLDPASLRAVRDELGLGTELALLDDAGRPVVSTVPATRFSDVHPSAGGAAAGGAAAGGAAAGGAAAGWRYAVRAQAPAVPYTLLSLARAEGSGVRR